MEKEVFVFPTSFAQQRLWFLDQLEPNSHVYNIVKAVQVKGPLDVDVLQKALDTIVARHEALRTTFIAVDGNPVQVIAESRPIDLIRIDLRALPAGEREVELHRLVTAQARRPFNLSQDLMLRVTVLRLDEQEYALLLVMHHSASDGWSMGLLYRELIALYTAFSTGQPSSLPELSIQYADFAVWQRQWLQGEELAAQLAYWKRQLGGALPVLKIPTDRPRPAVQTYRGARHLFVLPTRLSEALKTLSRQQGVTLFMTLLAAFQTLLQRYTGQDDILVGSPIAGRTRAETEVLIGFFVNTLVLRADLSGNPTFRELLRRVREVALQAYAHQDLPFEKLVEELRPERDRSRSPLFQVMFILQNAPMEALELPGLTVSPLTVDSGTAKFDLTLSIVEKADGLTGVVEYNTDLFDAATIIRMMGHFQTLLAGIVVDPDQQVSTLPLMPPTERQQILIEWNDTRSEDAKESCIHQLFEAQVGQIPEAVAVVWAGRQFTYSELNAQANQLAHYLRARGVGPETLVGICVERSLEMVVGLLGILKAGGAYVPLDPRYPQERLAFMLADTHVPVLLTQQRLVARLPAHGVELVCLDTDWQRITRESTENPPSRATADTLAYVLYTSGSTGQPKGVAIQHRSTVAFVDWAKAVFPPQDLAGVLASTSICFDLSVFELFVPLSCGGTVILAENALQLSTLPAATAVTLINTVPSAIAELLRVNGVPASVRTVNLAGEPLRNGLVQQLYQQDTIQRVFNLYGPTEDTTYSTFALMKKGASGSPPIGRPITNTQIYLLDANLQPVPVGIPGELHIGGVGLARGYLNRPELTEQKFIPHPFSVEPGVRLYKTGDLARYLPNGDIEYLGRLDHQVKLRGFRIELGEIETVLGQHPAVREAIVLVREDEPGDKRLVAYVVPHQELAPTGSDLRSFLQTKLPAYMLPSAFVLLDMLPLTPNGKVDRRTLPAPVPSRPASEKVLTAPRDALELQLTQIWQTVLNIKTIGVRDNFFELGGHSLLAVRLFAQIEKTCGKSLPLATLFQASTIEQLANALRQDEWSMTWSSLVAIQPSGPKPPLFCVHAHDGGVLLYRELAPRLGTDQPVYGLQAQGLDGKQNLCTRLEDMAAHYIKEIYTLQPEGPYFLSGFCFGGTVAFEMAQQLQAQGQKVALLALFDTYGPGYPKSLPKTTLLRHKVSRHWGDLSRLGLKEQLTYVLTRMLARTRTIKETVKKRTWKIAYKSYVSTGRPLPRVLRNIAEINIQAARNYVRQVYPGQIILFRASEQPAGCYPDPQLGWGGLAAGGLEIYEVPNDHDTMLRNPILAEQVKACLQQAQATVSSIQT